MRATVTACGPWLVQVRTLGRFEVLIDGQPLEFAGRVQRRPLELLKAVVAFGGRDVPVSNVIDSLWPDAEADAGRDALAKALRRLRVLLRSPAAVTLRDGKLSLEQHVVWVDVLSLQRLLAQEVSQVDFAQILDLYQGDFLAMDSEAHWVWNLRERLRDRMLQQLVRGSRTMLQEGRCQQAIALLEKGLDIDPLTEELYLNLMRCHQLLGQAIEALTVYRRCQRVLSASGLTPSPEVEARSRELRAGSSGQAGVAAGATTGLRCN